MHPNTYPEAIVDKNGVATTRHKKSHSVDEGASRSLPSPSKAITAAERTSQSTSEQKMAFDLATLIIQSIHPAAKTATVVEIDGSLSLVAVDGVEIEEGRQEFLAGAMLNFGVVNEGTYKLGSAVSADKVEKELLGNVLRMTKPETTRLNSGGLSDAEGLAVLYIGRTSNSQHHLEYLADDLGSSLGQHLAVINESSSESLVDSLVASEDPVVRAAVARKTRSSSVLSRLSRDSEEPVRANAVNNRLAEEEDLVWAYQNSRAESVRADSVKHENFPANVARDAYEKDWSYKVIIAAEGKLTQTDIEATLDWDGSAHNSFMKDDEVKAVAKKAAAYTTTVSIRGKDVAGEPVVISDSEARAIAWRITSRMKSDSISAFKSLESGSALSLSKLASEAAHIKDTKLDRRAYGLKWDADDYMKAIIGWARTKQEMNG